MKITDINRTKRGRFSVFVDDEFYGVLHSDIYLSGRLKIDQLISQEDLDQLIHDSQIIIAKERALGLLSARSYTRRGLKDKLLRDVDEAAADSVIQRMEELGLIDDADYAKRFAKDCINLRGFSHSRTVSALFQKGIDREIIDETMESLGGEQSEKLILKLVRKKYRNKIETENDLRRTINALQRRGFKYSDIKLVLENLSQDPEYYDDYWEEWEID